FQPGLGVVILAARQHRPQLSCVLVGDGHEDLAEWQSTLERLDPELLGRGPLTRYRVGALQAASGALDQQRPEIAVTATADAAESRSATAGMLHRHQHEPRGELSPVAELLR